MFQLHYYTSLWNYLHHQESNSLEEVIREVHSNGFDVELWPFFLFLDPYTPSRQTSPGLSESDFGDLFLARYRERLRIAVGGVPTTWHSRGTSERPMVRTFEGHKEQIDTAAYIGSTIISVHDIGENVTNRYVGEDLDMARKVLAYASERGVILALETADFDACKRATDELEELRICLDPAYIHHYSGHTIGEYLDAFSDRISYLHLYDSTTEISHLTPGSGDVPQEDWLCLLAYLKESGYGGPAAFEIHPPSCKSEQTALEAVIEAREFLDGLLSTV